MKTVNALVIRNRLGEVLDELARTGEPVLVSKGREPRAVLVTVEDFRRRFVDKLAQEERLRLLEAIGAQGEERVGTHSSLEVLRSLRGYAK